MSTYITYTTLASIGEFTPTTVHSSTAHNTPHSDLIANDNALDTALGGVASSVTTLQGQVAALQAAPSTGRIVRIIPVQQYIANNTTFTADNGMPPEWPLSVTYNTADIRVWKTQIYPLTIPYSGISGILAQVAIMTTSSSSCYVYLRSASCPQFVAGYSRSRSNSDDGASDTNIIELPYESGRTFESYFNAVWGNGYAFVLTVLGYRT